MYPAAGALLRRAFCRLAAVFAWLDTGVGFKGAAEIKRILISHQFPDLLDLHIRVADEKPLGLIHAKPGKILGGRKPRIFFENFAEIFLREAEP